MSKVTLPDILLSEKELELALSILVNTIHTRLVDEIKLLNIK